MTKEDIVFKVKEGYVLQKDLESWYDNGLVKPQDRVQIIDKNNTNVDFEIETLIRINGSMYPFRRVKNFWRKVEKVQGILAESGRGSMEENFEEREISGNPSRSLEKTEDLQINDLREPAEQESWKPEVRIQQEHFGYQTDYHPHYVPLLHIPSLQSVMVFQDELIQFIRDMTLWPSGRMHAAQLRVDWNCEFCKIPIFSELEAFNHIVSDEHLAMMGYIAPSCDLDYWKHWVAKVNTESSFTPQPLMDYCSFLQTPSRQIAVSVPRVPMLDPLPYGWEYFRVTNAHERNVESWNAFQRGGEATLRKARSQIVQWHCTYCSKHGHEVHLGNMLYAFRHVFSGSHWKNMNYITCNSDIQFWASWIDSVVEVDPVVTYNPLVPPPATVTLDSVPVARVVPMKTATVSQQEEKATVIQNEDLKPTVIQDATVTPMEPADPVNTVVEKKPAVPENTVSMNGLATDIATVTEPESQTIVSTEATVTPLNSTVTQKPNVATVTQDTVHEEATVTAQKKDTVAEQSKSEKPKNSMTKNMTNRQKSDKKKCCIQ